VKTYLSASMLRKQGLKFGVILSVVLVMRKLELFDFIDISSDFNIRWTDTIFSSKELRSTTL